MAHRLRSRLPGLQSLVVVRAVSPQPRLQAEETKQIGPRHLRRACNAACCCTDACVSSSGRRTQVRILDVAHLRLELQYQLLPVIVASATRFWVFP